MRFRRSGRPHMKRPWLAALLNFFFMGPGTLDVGERKLFGTTLTLGAESN